MYKSIVDKFKYNKFLRNLTLSLGYKFPNLINWKKQLKNTDQFKDIKKINKEVLIAPVVTSDQILVSLHSILGFHYKLKELMSTILLVIHLLVHALMPIILQLITMNLLKMDQNSFVALVTTVAILCLHHLVRKYLN